MTLSERQMKEQLSEKELRIYELELEVKDLKVEVSSLYDAKDKLDLANRNARVLEEENIRLHNLIKGKPGGEGDAEALKLIKENETLRDSLRDKDNQLKSSLEKMRADCAQQDKSTRDILLEKEKLFLENERLLKELETLRRQCVDSNKLIEEEKEKVKESREFYEIEKERFEQKLAELSENGFTASSSSPRKDGRTKAHLKDTVPYSLHKEEVNFLEKRYKELQEKYWQKEKEWMQQESKLRSEIKQAAVNNNETFNDKELLGTLQAQIASLKSEIEFLRSERKTGYTFSPLNDDNESVIPYAESIRGSQRYKPQPPAAVEKLSDEYEALSKENEALRNKLDEIVKENMTLQYVGEERNLHMKQIEAALASERQRTPEAKSSPVDRRSDLQKKLNEAQRQLAEVTSSKEQRDILNNVRQKEYQRQIDELLSENKDLRSSVESNLSSDAIARLLKDKRDSVEDVMRLLEAAWQSDEEARALLRRAQFQLAQLAEANALKDEEIRRLQKALDNMEDRLRDALEENDRLRRELEKKNSDLADLERKLKELEKDINDLSRENDDLRNENKQLAKENANLRRDQDDLEKQLDAIRKGNDGELDELNRVINDLRDENNRLRRQLATANSPQRWSEAPRRISDATPLSDRRRSAVPEGAHLSVTVVELCDVLRNGQPITEPGFIIIKLKSIKEKYKTTVRELSSVIRFNETFVFYLAQPDQDIITLHVFYKPKSNNKEYHIGDACFSMATLHRGVARQRIAPVAQNPGTKDARRAAQVEVNLQTDDFGKMSVPSFADVQNENARFNELVTKSESAAPEILHAVDVYMAKNELQ